MYLCIWVVPDCGALSPVQNTTQVDYVCSTQRNVRIEIHSIFAALALRQPRVAYLRHILNRALDSTNFAYVYLA